MRKKPSARKFCSRSARAKLRRLRLVDVAALCLFEVVAFLTDPLARDCLHLLRGAWHLRDVFARHDTHEFAAHRAFFRHARILTANAPLHEEPARLFLTTRTPAF